MDKLPLQISSKFNWIGPWKFRQNPRPWLRLDWIHGFSWPTNRCFCIYWPNNRCFWRVLWNSDNGAVFYDGFHDLETFNCQNFTNIVSFVWTCLGTFCVKRFLVCYPIVNETIIFFEDNVKKSSGELSMSDAYLLSVYWCRVSVVISYNLHDRSTYHQWRLTS